LIAFVAAPETTYITPKDGNANYYVTAVYAEGESLPSMEVSTQETAISEVMAELPGDACIYDIQGRQLSQLQPGVNIVRYSNGTVRKVLVK
jgi:hypothetical protein